MLDAIRHLAWWAKPSFGPVAHDAPRTEYDHEHLTADESLRLRQFVHDELIRMEIRAHHARG